MGLRLRPAGLTLFVVFLALLGTAIRLAYQIRVAHDAGLPSGVNFSYGPGITFALLWIALVTPLVMWRDEDPSQRAYHWSMPVSPVVHALARTFAGWCWLMIATAMLLLGHVAIVAFTERITGVAQPYSKIASWWEWLIPFTSLTVAYLFASAAAVGARRPIVWLFGPMIIYFGAYLLAYAFIRTSGYPLQLVLSVIAGRYGAAAAMAGVFERFVNPSMVPVMNTPLDRWLGATAIWGAASVALFCVTMQRRTVPS